MWKIVFNGNAKMFFQPLFIKFKLDLRTKLAKIRLVLFAILHLDNIVTIIQTPFNYRVIHQLLIKILKYSE